METYTYHESDYTVEVGEVWQRKFCATSFGRGEFHYAMGRENIHDAVLDVLFRRGNEIEIVDLLDENVDLESKSARNLVNFIYDTSVSGRDLVPNVLCQVGTYVTRDLSVEGGHGVHLKSFSLSLNIEDWSVTRGLSVITDQGSWRQPFPEDFVYDKWNEKVLESEGVKVS